jgi:serine/threonine-protein kinase
MLRRLGWPATLQGRERLRAALLFGGVALAGYLLTCLAFPAPLLPRDRTVDRVLGLPLAEAERQLAEAGLKARLEGEERDPVVPAGHVSWQDPPPGTALPEGAVVLLTVSAGPAPVTVPDLAGFEPAQAREVLEAAGLWPGAVDSVPSMALAGVIVATRPAAGTGVPAGARVGLLVSRGPADVRVPALVGLELEAARTRLESQGLRIGRVTRRSARELPGLVVQQRPSAGVLVPQQSRVDLVVSQ